MKDQYCGDINDYRKYGILRALTTTGLSLGVCWMLTDGDGSTDGKHTTYLAKPESWRKYDPAAFDLMHAVVNEHGRAVRHIESSPLFPGARFFSDLVPDHKPHRHEWFSRCTSALHGIDLVFFDPDNGLEVSSVRCGNKGSSKYLYWHEVEAAWAGGHSLLIYQHYPRQERAGFVLSLIGELKSRTDGATVVPLSTSNVVFFLVMQERHTPTLQAACGTIAQTWTNEVEVLRSQPCELIPS